MFKLGKFEDAHAIFNNLIVKEQESKFKGKDRRLYYNKAVCELQMGRYDLCILTANTNLKYIKEQFKMIEE